MRQFIIYVMFVYAGLFGAAFVVMLIHHTLVTGLVSTMLALPWSGLAGLYLNQCSFINDPANPKLAIFTIEATIVASGLLNVAILFGISRLFKKSN